jgi:hypothetical protein
MPWRPNPLQPGEWEWYSPDPQGEVAFNLRDVSEEHPDVFTPDDFIGKEDVAMTIRVGRTIDKRTGESATHEITVFFDGGENEEEFWDNYHEAIREAIDETADDFQDDFPDVDIDESSSGADVAVVAIGR